MNRPLEEDGACVDSRSGVALVITLAFLALLLILTISFSTLMRTERFASRNYSDIAKARFMTQTALARAVVDLDSNLGGTPYPNWGPLEAFGSAGVAGDNDSIHLDPIEEIRKFYPGSAAQWATLSGDVSSGNVVKWERVDDPDDGSVIGRTSYLVFDCSGLLDINQVMAIASNRNAGLSAAEIQLNNAMAEISSVPEDLWSNRLVNVRYSSLPELLTLGTSTFYRVLSTGRDAENLFTYSKFPVGRWDVTGTEPEPEIFIGTQASILAKKNDITTAFRSADFNNLSVGEAEALYANLVDYVDTDNFPGNGSASIDLKSICTEAVPMINEITITNTMGTVMQGSNIIYRSNIDLKAETWYPFVGTTNGNNYTLVVQIISSGGTAGFRPSTSTPLTWSAPGPWPGPNRFRVSNRFQATATYTNEGAVVGGEPAIPTELIARVLVKEGGAGGVSVDQVDIRLDWAGSPNFVQNVPAVGSLARESVDLECNDPRINWDFANASQWIDSGGNTMGDMNDAVTFGAPRDDSWQMFVRNGPPVTPGELGLLLYGTNAWRTIPLYDAAASDFPVLDYFTTRTDTSFDGLLNPNTRKVDALAAAFFDCPIETYPGDPAAQRLTWAQAQALANELVTNTAVYNTGELFAGLADAEFNAAVAGRSTLQKEAIIRNTASLLEPRQQLFVVIAEGQVVKDLDTDNTIDPNEVFGTQKALAVVWRDAYRTTTPDPEYPTFVHFFKWLTD